MCHFIGAIITAAAGTAEIHSDMLSQFEISCDIPAQFHDCAGGFMSHDSHPRTYRSSFQRPADRAFPMGRPVQTRNHFGGAAADSGISYFYFYLVSLRLRLGNIL